MTNFLIADDIHPVFMERLEGVGIGCTYRPEISLKETLETISRYQGVGVRSKFNVDAAFIDAGRSLKVIARAGAGMDNIDYPYALSKGIACVNAPEGNRNAVAEHTVGLMLALLNKMVQGNNEIREGRWRRVENTGEEIAGKTVGIIGYGNMGGAFAKKLRAFDVRVIAYDKYAPVFPDHNAKSVSLPQIYAEADVLSLHIPLTAETRYWVDDRFIGAFKKNFYLLNTSRGEIVRTASLTNALISGKVKGAALDVLEKEKFPLAPEDLAWFEKLIALKNVILTPHVAGWSHESYYQIGAVLAQKIISLKVL